MQSSDIQSILSELTDELRSALSDSNSFGIALFTETGDLLFANAAMSSLCPDFDSASLLNPTFANLSSLRSADSLLFSGLLTIGTYNNINTSIEAKVYRKGGKLLITGGINASDLIVQNKTMHFLNLKVTNLQRQLIQEKAELERTMAELKETQQMLVYSEKMNAMGKLVAGVAHELNNPISFVYSNLFSLEKCVVEVLNTYREVEELIGLHAGQELTAGMVEIRKRNDLDYLFGDMTDMTRESKIGVERVKAIVEDLRRFSRLDEAEIKQVDLIENIKSTISIARSEISRKNISFHLSASDSLQVECYPGQLNQAVLNVLINAVDAVDRGGHISLSVAEEEQDIRIEVKDDGHGIPEEIKDHIFDPFFTTKPVGSGTGLGLSITYKIIHDLHHGSIEVDSASGRGTCIKLKIPRKIWT